MNGVLEGLRALPRGHKLAGGAALALIVTLFLPWYAERRSDESVSGISAFTFVEAAVLLVALGVLLIVYLRSQRRAFHLPGGDGGVIFVAGVWCALLIFYRMVIDRPGSVEEFGIEWGIFAGMLCAGALAWTGLQIRAADSPEPPLPPRAAEEEPTAPHEAATRRLPPSGPGSGGDSGEQLTLDDPPPPRPRRR